MADYSLPDLNFIIPYLGIPANYFQFPEIITMLIFPGILMTYALYNFLNERVAVFRGNTFVNGLMAILVAISMLRFSYIALWISVAYILVFKIHSLSWKLTFVLVIASVYFSISLLIFAVWAFIVASALSKVGRSNGVIYVIVVIVVSVVFYFVYAYISPFIPSIGTLLTGKFP